jgi:hypothetical protein
MVKLCQAGHYKSTVNLDIYLNKSLILIIIDTYNCDTPVDLVYDLAPGGA